MTNKAELMGAEYKEVRDDYVEEIKNKGHNYLAEMLETKTAQELAKDDFINGLKEGFPNCGAELEALKEEIQELQQDEKEAYDWTQYFETTPSGGKKFQPKYLADDIEEDYTFYKIRDSEQIYVYKDGFYQPKGQQVIESETEKRLQQEFRANRLREVKAQIESRNYIKRKEFRPPKRKINLENGVYDLEKEELKSHSSEYFFTHKIPVKYNPEADCQNIHSFLNDIVETEKEVKTLMEIAGYLLLPDYPIPKAFMLVGKGNNGKSRYLDLLRELVGEDNLTEKGLQDLGGRFGTNELQGRLGCLDDDLSSRKIDEEAAGTMKKLTGGSRIGAEVKYGGHYNFYNYANLVFACNELPRTRDDTDGFFRRWIIVEFPYKFKENPAPENELEKQGMPKKKLMDQITHDEEIEAFLWWALESLKDVLENDEFTHAPSTEDAREKWREYSVPLVKFIEEYVKQGVTRSQAEREAEGQDAITSYDYDYVRKDFLKQVIGDYCEARSHSRPSKKAITKELEKEFYVGTKSRTRKEPEDSQVPVYSGIKLDYPDAEKCAGVQTYSETFTHACAHTQAKGSKQSVHTGTDSDGYGTLHSRIMDRFGDEPLDEQQLIDSMEEDNSRVEKALSELKSEGRVYEPENGKVQEL